MATHIHILASPKGISQLLFRISENILSVANELSNDVEG
jgi:hypothetical protein